MTPPSMLCNGSFCVCSTWVYWLTNFCQQRGFFFFSLWSIFVLHVFIWFSSFSKQPPVLSFLFSFPLQRKGLYLFELIKKNKIIVIFLFILSWVLCSMYPISVFFKIMQYLLHSHPLRNKMHQHTSPHAVSHCYPVIGIQSLWQQESIHI